MLFDSPYISFSRLVSSILQNFHQINPTKSIWLQTHFVGGFSQLVSISKKNRHQMQIQIEFVDTIFTINENAAAHGKFRYKCSHVDFWLSWERNRKSKIKIFSFSSYANNWIALMLIEQWILFRRNNNCRAKSSQFLEILFASLCQFVTENVIVNFSPEIMSMTWKSDE